MSLSLVLFCHLSVNQQQQDIIATYDNVDVLGYTKESLYWYDSEGGLSLECAISVPRQNEYCGLKFYLPKDPWTGRYPSFSRLKHIIVDAKVSSTRKNVKEGLGVTVRSLRPDRQYIDGDFGSTRFQSVRFDPNGVQEIDANRFTLDGWWQRDYNVPYEIAMADLSDVVSIAIYLPTGREAVSPGKYDIQIKRLVFVQEIITESTVNALLALTWPVASLIFIGHYLLLKRRELSRLQALNHYDAEMGMLNLSGFKSRFPETIKSPMTLVNIRIRNFRALQREFSRETVVELVRATFLPFSRGGKDGPLLVHKQDENILLALDECDEAFFATLVTASQRGVSFTSLGHLRLDVKIGIAKGEPGTAIDELLSQTTIAIDAILDAEPSYKIYEPHLRKEYRQARYIEQELRNALANKAFYIVFMPMYDAVDKRISGAEVLIRTRHLPLASFTVEQFICVAEKVGLIREIDFWVMEQAVQALAKIKQPDFVLSVNISSKELMDTRFADELSRLIKHYNVRPESLCLEITETFFVDVNTICFESIQALRSLGVRLSLDDFGTGHVSLQHLLNIPINELKIDRSFVWSLDNDKSAVIVDAIVSIARICDYGVVAEGVETQEQLEQLIALGCRYFQGYLIAKPDSLEALLVSCKNVRGTISTLKAR
ncbi:EAL domain-containing protein [Alteromonas sp. C1M14]|uniref:EAL domain-containing protein n=1 Tax=Alteromonas sp. C1M14 TaxID=2841567 RepID=UPI001C09AA75|nr:EAL domain-containing protein [Alteromonas sp. C1M14]